MTKEFVVELFDENDQATERSFLVRDRHEAEAIAARLVDNGQYKSIGVVYEIL